MTYQNKPIQLIPRFKYRRRIVFGCGFYFGHFYMLNDIEFEPVIGKFSQSYFFLGASQKDKLRRKNKMSLLLTSLSIRLTFSSLESVNRMDKLVKIFFIYKARDFTSPRIMLYLVEKN